MFCVSFFLLSVVSRGLLSHTGLAGWSRLTPLCGVLLDQIPAGLPGYSKTVVREEMWAHRQYSLLVVGAVGGRISWDPESALWERLWGDPVPPRREYSLVVSNAGSEVDFAEVVNPSSHTHSCLTSSSCGPSPVCQMGTTVPNLTGLFWGRNGKMIESGFWVWQIPSVYSVECILHCKIILSLSNYLENEYF